MLALATRPRPWRMVNQPPDQPDDGFGRPWMPTMEPSRIAIPPDDLATHNPSALTRGPLDLKERIFTGDALARFASARLDPNAAVGPIRFDDEDSMVELELISTGGDPEAEARKAAMMAAHPEGKPIVTLRHGVRAPPPEPPLAGIAEDPLPDP